MHLNPANFRSLDSYMIVLGQLLNKVLLNFIHLSSCLLQRKCCLDFSNQMCSEMTKMVCVCYTKITTY